MIGSLKQALVMLCALVVGTAGTQAAPVCASLFTSSDGQRVSDPNPPLPPALGIGLLARSKNGRYYVAAGWALGQHSYLADQVPGTAAQILWAGEFQTDRNGNFLAINETSGSFNARVTAAYTAGGDKVEVRASIENLKRFNITGIDSLTEFIRYDPSNERIAPDLPDLKGFRHDFSTPLNGIIGFGQMVVGGHAPSKRAEYWDIIRESAQNLAPYFRIWFRYSEDKELNAEMLDIKRTLHLLSQIPSAPLPENPTFALAITTAERLLTIIRTESLDKDLLVFEVDPLDPLP